jgi:hypothetical protein
MPVVAQQQSWCGIQTLYFQHNESTSPPGYEELIDYPSGNPEVDESVTVVNTGGLALIDNYIMPEGSMKSTEALLPGLRRYRFYSYVSGASGVTTLNFTAFRRFDNGTEQNFYSARSDDIDALAVTEYDLNYVSQSTLQINPTDRLGIRVYASTTHSAPITVHWVYQGTAHASHFESGYFVCPPQNVPVYVQAIRQPLSACVIVGSILLAGLIIAYKKRKE